jgi:hypothetical protein
MFKERIRRFPLWNRVYHSFSTIYSSKSPLNWENYYSDSIINGEEIIGPEEIIRKEKNIIKNCTAKGIEKHLVSHLASSLDIHPKLESSVPYDRSMIRNYIYDMFLASTLNLDMSENFLLQNFYGHNIHWSKTTRVYDVKMDKYFLALSKSEKDVKMKQLFKNEEMNNLRILANVLGLRKDKKEKLNGNLELFKSKYMITMQDGVENTPSLSMPLVSAPILLKKSEIYKFAISANFLLYGDISSLDSFRDYFLTNRERYWKQLTGYTNPSSEDIRSALLSIDNFLQFVK